MPLNTLRLNHQKSSHPNDRVVFIKPLQRAATDQASYDIADTFLRAIAAQCLPIMKSHYLSVTTLEEHEPNREFIGRNFNNGEIIQLVLRTKGGGWVPFQMVQMVMMHELAHNTHMNHGKDFWKARNLYSGEMRGLWSKGYTGEGFWGSGRTLADMGAAMGNTIVSSEEIQDLPTCGGTFRSRRRKRKRGADGQELTWKEKRDKRIEKKFGKNGVSLGEDEDKRLGLELSGKGPIGVKPRVAQSKRGRELRAAAALARFDTNKKEVDDLKKEDGMEEESTDDDEYEAADADEEDAHDLDGKRITDENGNSMIRVCGDEDTSDIYVKQEQEELGSLEQYFSKAKPHINRGGRSSSKDDCEKGAKDGMQRSPKTVRKISDPAADLTQSRSKPPTRTTQEPKMRSCPICTLDNYRTNLACEGCGNVLIASADKSAWKCEKCRAQYLNPGDSARCAVCGSQRNETSASSPGEVAAV